MRLIKCPVALACPPDIDRVLKAVQHYSDGKPNPVVVFLNGTCVFADAESDIQASARKFLVEAGPASSDCVVHEMDDGNFLVGFSERVFGVVLRQEFDALRSTIIDELNTAAANAEEVILRRPNDPLDHAYIGLFARTRCVRDIEMLHVVTSS